MTVSTSAESLIEPCPSGEASCTIGDWFIHQVSETASFKQDLQLDSLDEVEIVMAIEEEFALEIPDAEADKIKSTRDVIEFVASHPRAK